MADRPQTMLMWLQRICLRIGPSQGVPRREVDQLCVGSAAEVAAPVSRVTSVVCPSSFVILAGPHWPTSIFVLRSGLGQRRSAHASHALSGDTRFSATEHTVAHETATGDCGPWIVGGACHRPILRCVPQISAFAGVGVWCFSWKSHFRAAGQFLVQ